MTARIRDRLTVLESAKPAAQPQMSKHERDQRFAAATVHVPDEQLSQIVRDLMEARSNDPTSTGGPVESSD